MGEILSMTGYGSAKGVVAGQELSVELKSVNNRYLDCAVRLPRSLLFAEEAVKQAVSAAVNRGKVDVFVSCAASAEADSVVRVNRELARSYFDAVSSIADELGIDSGISAMSIARFADVLSVEKKELDKDETAAALNVLTTEAVREFNAMRAREGDRLKADMLAKCEKIESYVTVVEARSPKTVEEYRQRLENKLREVLGDRNVEEQRLVTEAAIFADRTAVDEETVRLRSHIAQFRQLLETGSPVG
ncbi:MAG: YicC family protein, partial [Oscillospiraceae bacterium]|nr:YicC family protein [Oscillospiraceae bacterium]